MYCMIDPELCQLVAFGTVEPAGDIALTSDPLDHSAGAVLALLASAIWIGGLAWI